VDRIEAAKSMNFSKIASASYGWTVNREHIYLGPVALEFIFILSSCVCEILPERTFLANADRTST